MRSYAVRRSVSRTYKPRVKSFRRCGFGQEKVAPRRKNEGAFDHVLKLSDVAGPVVGHQPLHRRARNAVYALPERLALLGHDSRREHRNVFSPVAQRRNRNRKHAQPVEEVGAKPSRLDFPGKRALYWALLDILRYQGYANAFAGITLPNDASIGLHEAMGFQRIGAYERVGYKLGQWHTVGWWGLALQELVVRKAWLNCRPCCANWSIRGVWTSRLP